MSKVIVFDNCIKCPKLETTGLNGIGICVCTLKDRMPPVDYIPNWCPLPDLPEKQEGADKEVGVLSKTLDDIYIEGWNACLDAMTGGED